MEFLERLGFVLQLLVWLKPHMSPLYAWSAAVSASTVGKVPETVVLTLVYILGELHSEYYLVSALRGYAYSGEVFRTDAKCADDMAVLAGWEMDTGRRLLRTCRERRRRTCSKRTRVPNGRLLPRGPLRL